MWLANEGALGHAAPIARGFAQISRVNSASDAAPGFCIRTFTRRFISYPVIKKSKNTVLAKALKRNSPMTGIVN